MAVRPLPGQERHLIRRCVENDRQAQRQLYEQLAPTLMALCMRYLRNRHEAEDTLSNRMIKVFSHTSEFNGAGSFEGWAKRITGRECLNQIRQKRPAFTEMEAMQDDLNHATHSDPSEMEMLQRLVESLPLGYRTVLTCMRWRDIVTRRLRMRWEFQRALHASPQGDLNNLNLTIGWSF